MSDLNGSQKPFRQERYACSTVDENFNDTEEILIAVDS